MLGIRLGSESLEIWIGPGGIEKISRVGMESFFLKIRVGRSGSLFREPSWEMFQPMILGLFLEMCFRNRFGPVCIGRETVPVSVRGFRALKYDVRHTPIVIARIANGWKLKRT